MRDGALVEADGAAETAIVDVADVPITIGGLARHNVANALAAAGGARGLGATIAEVRDGLSHFAPDAERSPGRLNLYRLGSRVVIVDFAHNEAGMAAVLDVAQGIAAGAAGRAAPITAIIGTAGDRPDDTLRGIGRIAAERAQRVAIKQTLKYLRGRTAESVVGELMAGIVAGGGDAAEVPIYTTEPEALQAELNGAAGAGASGGRSDAARVVVLMCHEDRDGVFELLHRSRRAAGRRGLGADRARPAAAGPAEARLALRSPLGAVVLALLLLSAAGCAGRSALPNERLPTSPNERVPTGLPADHLLLAIDYVVEDPSLDGVYDPRWVALTADGRLVLERRDVDAILGTTVTKLDAAGLGRAWSAISRSGVFTDGNLRLPGFMEDHPPITADVFRVDDGQRSTRLRIASLGSEGVYVDDPPVPAGEMAVRAAATRLIDDMRAIGGRDPWTPPALLMWWRTELPADRDATIVGWSPPIDLATVGRAIEHPVWDRCVRLDGDEAASGRTLRELPADRPPRRTRWRPLRAPDPGHPPGRDR